MPVGTREYGGWARASARPTRMMSKATYHRPRRPPRGAVLETGAAAETGHRSGAVTAFGGGPARSGVPVQGTAQVMAACRG
ncbi:hypothetical protein ABB07_01310 [Streptomyces incarnatus]|uniref:Uncharacterized protein n=1 Tax=Streptomyces incarnatus TaxID=665007 RepID=A0ABM5TCQ8_9ACTN|nr:hypothetical protein ABB07_01310 [Streptomyces incarnatus]